MEYLVGILLLLLLLFNKKNILCIETRLTSIMTPRNRLHSIVGQDDIVCDIIIPITHHYINYDLASFFTIILDTRTFIYLYIVYVRRPVEIENRCTAVQRTTA